MPRRLPNVVTFRYQNKLAYVSVPTTHEEAQVLAVTSFPRALRDVEPEWISFSIAVRYRSTGERKEINIEPRSWYRVTSKLVPYRCIDIHVVIPPPQRGSSSTSSTTYSSLYPETPPQHAAPLYPESPSRFDVPLYHDNTSKTNTPPYPESSLPQRHASLYPDTPPPSYPGPTREIHPFLAQTGYGYGFGWHQPQGHTSQGYFEPEMYRHTRAQDAYEDDSPQADRRSTGWSASSVRVSSPVRDAPFPRSPLSGSGLGLFSSIRERIFPIGWAESRGRTRRRRQTSDYDRDDDDYEGFGRRRSTSYVPSLI
ncbi:hypothetical protein BU17DRAFT_83568 [Hysterangium stoloniferum]|nr:hypothetical protein BU17DRAFT_83568 [Hysterangium stoloniferum]